VDGAAWSVITALPAHPVITVAGAVAATGRTKPAVANAIEQLEGAGVLIRVRDSVRNRAWEADGLLDLIVGLEQGEVEKLVLTTAQPRASGARVGGAVESA
jgi:hypothetical protein